MKKRIFNEGKMNFFNSDVNHRVHQKSCSSVRNNRSLKKLHFARGSSSDADSMSSQIARKLKIFSSSLKERRSNETRDTFPFEVVFVRKIFFRWKWKSIRQNSSISAVTKKFDENSNRNSKFSSLGFELDWTDFWKTNFVFFSLNPRSQISAQYKFFFQFNEKIEKPTPFHQEMSLLKKVRSFWAYRLFISARCSSENTRFIKDSHYVELSCFFLNRSSLFSVESSDFLIENWLNLGQTRFVTRKIHSNLIVGSKVFSTIFSRKKISAFSYRIGREEKREDFPINFDKLQDRWNFLRKHNKR